MELRKYTLQAGSNGQQSLWVRVKSGKILPVKYLTSDMHMMVANPRYRLSFIFDLIRHKDFNTDLVVSHEFLA